MNKQIQQLAEQAGLYVDLDGSPWPQAMSAEACEAAYKKFAELIVRECAQVADAERPSVLGCGYITKTTGMRIKEHFGVEE